ncbi:MAG: inositol monophosphatase family protein [Candidatus Woesearchaeota archaeon]|nr:inositol monophosphatase family protein [Candidatus Woesearchaeota archaeon]
MVKHSAFLHTAIKAAKAAGVIIRKNFDSAPTVSIKKDSSFLTTTDLAAEKEIITILKKTFPHHQIYSEEAGAIRSAGTSEYLWLVDPLDGTTNFSIHNPFFNTAIALLHNGTPIVAVVYNPIANELFYAERGTGAFLNKKQIHVSAEKDPRNGVLSFCHGSTDKAVARSCLVSTSLKKNLTKHVRQLGAADLDMCYVAAGRVLCYYSTGPVLHPYDIYPGMLIAQEAGAVVSDSAGKPFTSKSTDILVSAPSVYDELLKHIHAALKHH